MIDTVTMTGLNVAATIDEHRPYITTTGVPNGQSYVMGQPNIGGGTSSPIGVYAFNQFTGAELNAGTGLGGVLTKLGTFGPVQLDATWSTWGFVIGFCYDQIDGNLIGIALTSDAGPTNKQYIFKLSSIDASLIWAIPVDAVPSGSDPIIQQWVCKSGALFMVSGHSSGGNYNEYIVNTIAGTLFATNAIPSYSGGATFSDDSLGRVFSYGGVTIGAGTPIAVGGSPSSWSNQWSRLDITGVPPLTVSIDKYYTVSAAVGFTYTSQGQLLRPLAPQETGAQNGPALGKTRRTHMFGALLHRTQGISFGVDFNTLLPVKFSDYPGGPVYPLNALFSGVYWDSLNGSYDFNSMPCWQISRPYPATVVAFQSFLQTQDR